MSEWIVTPGGKRIRKEDVDLEEKRERERADKAALARDQQMKAKVKRANELLLEMKDLSEKLLEGTLPKGSNVEAMSRCAENAMEAMELGEGTVMELQINGATALIMTRIVRWSVEKLGSGPVFISMGIGGDA